jgi:hypothetical protein
VLIASALGALANCEKSGNGFAQTWRGRLSDIERGLLPSGSGFDGGTLIEPTRDGFELVTSFHHMDDSGFYDGWTDHRIRVRASFDGFALSISGRARNGIKEYIADTFAAALDTPARWTAESVEAVPVIPLLDYAEAAASLWESFIDAMRTESAGEQWDSDYGPVTRAALEHGQAALRASACDHAAACHIAWQHATRHGYDSCLDWQFCSRFAAACLDWSDGLPTLRADFETIAESLATAFQDY